MNLKSIIGNSFYKLPMLASVTNNEDLTKILYGGMKDSSRMARQVKLVSDGRALFDLPVGFNLQELEDYIVTNEENIKSNLQDLGWSLEELRRERMDFSAVADVLGVDLDLISDWDLTAITSTIAGLLADDIDDSIDDNSIVDLLWVLRSSGVAYESFKSMGSDEKDYREYIMGLIEENGLLPLVSENPLSDAAPGVAWSNELIEDLESETDFDVLSYDDFSIDVIDRNGSGGDSDRFRVETPGKSYADVVRAVIGKPLKDSVSAQTSWQDVAEFDFNESVEQDWSSKEYESYTYDVLHGYTSPNWFFKAPGATDGSGDVNISSKFVQDFLLFNEESLTQLSSDGGYPDMELWQVFLVAYSDEIEDLARAGNKM